MNNQNVNQVVSDEVLYSTPIKAGEALQIPGYTFEDTPKKENVMATRSKGMPKNERGLD